MPRSFTALFSVLALLAAMPSGAPAAMTPDEVRNVLFHLEKANKGDAAAQFALGRCYAQGEGAEKDSSRAFAWYRKAADQGHVEAQLMVGLGLLQGDGITQDVIEAYAYLSLASPVHAQARSSLDLLEKQLEPARLEAARKRTTKLRSEIASRHASKAPAN
jgi:TPR repeat protein